MMDRAVQEVQASLFQQARAGRGRPLGPLLPVLIRREVLCEAWRRSLRGVSEDATQEKDGEGSEKPIPQRRNAIAGPPPACLVDLAERLRDGTYRPGPVRRFRVPKPNRPGQTRPVVVLGETDRIVHWALKLLLEPIVEARQSARSFGFRPGRSRFDQLLEVRAQLGSPLRGIHAAVTADIASCFDRLDHELLRADVASLTTDLGIQALIALLLRQVGSGCGGWWHRRPVGVLQGSPLSPLLANAHLARLDGEWERRHGSDAPLYRYADDLIVLARDAASARGLQGELARILHSTTRLQLASDKTRVATVDEGIPLLGMVLRRHQDPFDRTDRIRVFLDPDRIAECLGVLSDCTEGLASRQPLGPQIETLNQRLRGWFEAFQFAHDAAEAFETLDRHVYRLVGKRLRARLGLSEQQLRKQCATRLRSGHCTWTADGRAVLVLSSLPRRRCHPRRSALPWTDANDRPPSDPGA